ncbi:cold-shock protein [Providencia burhodogranariea DSM 19968]|uniref:Cold-shock protein n=1 Tax=Providencia burhodogranariea DSM 19968 TaxID=1141662 RepID=K8W883_9GAMM|nr:cold-shock protein [Providencia burhodogranariea DSM 19968]
MSSIRLKSTTESSKMRSLKKLAITIFQETTLAFSEDEIDIKVAFKKHQKLK